LVAFAYSAGLIAFLNPCGFAILPSYVSYSVANPEAEQIPIKRRLARGALVGLIITLGFIAIFGSVGAVFSYFGSSLAKYVVWASVAIGAVIIVLGALLLRNKTISIAIHNPVRISGRGYSSSFMFGIGYSVTSISCTMPIFLLVVTTALATGGFLDGLVIFLTYAIGMGTAMTVFSAAVSASRHAVVAKFRNFMQYVKKISGIVLIAAGAYVIYYQFFLGGFIASPIFR